MVTAAKNKFVFVVCGAREHIETLHFSLAALKEISVNEIWVITDELRNEIPVLHDRILNITTPAEYNHHQASIYLKTGLHKFLPAGNSYCYLDTDVVALNADADEIFKHKTDAITFAADHCSLRQFSPHAVNCNCAAQHQGEQQEIKQLLQKFSAQPDITDPQILKKQRRLQQKLEVIKYRKPALIWMALRFILSPDGFDLDNEFRYLPQRNAWVDASGTPVLYETPYPVIRQIEKNTAWRFSKWKRRWISPAGNDVALLECGHLKQAISDKFNVVIDDHWQHWNGGVFLLDDSSHRFMEAWHQNTLTIFKDAYWKTRDQGTLITTAWQLGLQQLPVLPKKFNFIAYFYNPALMLSEDQKTISDNALVNNYEPAFIHVFDHFGVKDWDVWNWIKKKVTH